MKRIGMALTSERGGRRYEFGIYEHTTGGRSKRYEGSRTADGTQTGLPLSGPLASWAQPLTPFEPTDFAIVRYFADADAVQR